ncbi:flagellar basal-body MS-ring/collar protein FliF [Salibacterium halotolerans]|uniref:Flagellar M-ring protein n=1 Tax=Salibacterium halotolerans TaxID=1884432 RepID=A0A1I5MCS2_9BACI|nr:flagellar basal-body MS-ring/collar protein FliF [Salibacterium halotolerans]SFP07365.1 flagellar M-ring protein FliF [Salibacterium halotolerans]
MKEKVLQFRQKTTEYWRNRSGVQKILLIGSFVLLILIIILAVFFTSRTNYAPLYSELTQEETGQITQNLDSRGVTYELANNGSTIRVPQEQVDSLKVDLAAEGLPDSGSIDYSFIEDQMGFGMTDNEFNTMERAAIQTELGRLMENIDGVEAADVMLNMPEESTWVSEQGGNASASVVVDTGGSANLEQSQVRALYHLVAKSVPDLTVDNIVIMNQMFEQFTYENAESGSTMSAYEEQRSIQEDIEKDIQSRLQQMLGRMMGLNKVAVSVTTDLDFTQETREEALVEPVDEENMEGIAVSAERIEEAYEGQPPEDGGTAGAGEGDVANYPAGAGTGQGDYQRDEERINYEVNRIHREITESPYKIRDLGIQVMVEPPEPNNPDSLDPQTITEIEEMLTTMVSTSINQEYQDNMEAGAIEDNIYVASQPFNGQQEMPEETSTSSIPMWAYIAGGALLFTVLALIIILIRRRNHGEEEWTEEEMTAAEPVPDIPDEDNSEEAQRRKQLENLAQENPEEFSKLLRTWLSDE